MSTTVLEPRHTSRTGAAAFLDPLRTFGGLWRERELVVQLTTRELLQTWRESVLGAAWAVLQPILTLAVYSFVFLVLFEPRRRAPGQGPFDFVIELFCGLLVYWAFSETIARAPTLVVGRPNLVKNVVFPLEVLPVTVLGAALVQMLVGMVVLLAAVLVARGSLSPTIWALPLVILPLSLGTLGLAWLLASLGVFLRDVQQGIRVGLQLFLYLTPVVWRIEWVPERWRLLALANPMAGIVESARAVLIRGELPAWGPLAWSSGVAMVLFVVGRAWFAKTRWGFADVV
jgi:lipopolysaccharide transport system permease protein